MIIIMNQKRKYNSFVLCGDNCCEKKSVGRDCTKWFFFSFILGLGLSHEGDKLTISLISALRQIDKLKRESKHTESHE